ncbi:MAG: hypothetical protein HDR74_08020 [Bacteroides sp.]|nr:hypothetical protein [Bacteroides sp.]
MLHRSYGCYLPPNGWNCRCTVEQVLRDDYPMSDPEMAKAAGDACTDEPKMRMFRYNAGQEMTVFPKKHPYLPKGCGDCPRRGNLTLATRPDRALPQCRTCGVVFKECRKIGEQRLKEWKLKKIPEREGLSINADNFKTGSLLITRQSVKGVIGHTLNLAVRDSLLGIENGVANYKYIGWRECEMGDDGVRKHPEAAFFLYYEIEIAGKTYYANVKANRDRKVEELYCIRDKCNISNLRRDDFPTIENW